MIEALRITITGNITHSPIQILETAEWSGLGIPDMFEDSQLVFTSKDGTYVMPDYNIRQIQLRCGRISPPKEAIKLKRVLISDDLNYVDCYLIQPGDYDKYGIPQVFRPFEQFTWVCRDGLFIAPDFQVVYVQV